MGRDTVQLETAVSTISQGYLLEFTSEYGISEALHPELPGPEDRIMDFPEGKIGVYTKVDVFQQEAREKYPSMLYQAFRFLKNWNNRFFWVDERVFPTIVDWRTSAPKDGMPAENTYSLEAVMILNTHHMDLFNLICAPNPTKVKTGSRPRAAHEVPLLTVTANRVIEIEEPTAATDLSGEPSTIERSPLDFANENPLQQSTGPEDQEAAALEVPPPENVTTTGIDPEAVPAERVAVTSPPVVKERRKRSHDGVDTNAPPKVVRRDHADPRSTKSTREGKSLAAIELGMRSTRPIHVPQGAPVDVINPDPLSFADPPSRPSTDVTQSYKEAAAAEDPESENTLCTSIDLVDHIAPSRYFSELCHLHNDDFLKQYNINLAWQVSMGSQLRLRFEQEAKLLKKSVAQVAHRDKRIQARENEIKNLETLLEAEADMKKTAENKSAELSAELENMWALFSDLHVSNNCLSQQVSTLQEQVMGEEMLKAAFKEFKKNKHDLVEQRSIAGCRWVIGRGLRLAVMKCGESTELRQAFADVVSVGIAKGMSEGLKHGVEHGKAKLDLEAIEAYDSEAEAKNITALHALKNLKYPLVDQLESLNDAPIDVIMASLHLESDTEDDAPQWIRELPDTIAANVSRVEKKKKCKVVCRTHGVGFAHHTRFDGVLVSVPTVAPQGLAILLADAATQTETSDEASPRLLRSGSLPVMHG
uniref:Transposase (Putative), gypsy type n=1 Tax=Tanacetum cinerariifolium TaxID=118510 RepID=A0A6L2M182_TANCI|nr:hypothetical protein [Tanacetum cinerariifolium]